MTHQPRGRGFSRGVHNTSHTHAVYVFTENIDGLIEAIRSPRKEDLYGGW